MGLGKSKETHFSLLKKAESVLSDVFATSEHLEGAIELCRSAIDECPTYPFSYMILAKLLMRLGRYREAADATVDCIELSPTEMYSMYFMLADCLEECDEYEAAMAAIAKVPKGRRDELRTVHERRKQYLVQSVPPRDVSKNSSPLVPSPPASIDAPVDIKSQGSLSDGISLSTDDTASAQHESSRDVPRVLPPLGPSAAPKGVRDADDAAIEDWYDNRECEFGAALKRDTNYKKFLLGERGQYLLRPRDKTRMRRIGEHRDRFNRLSAASLHQK